MGSIVQSASAAAVDDLGGPLEVDAVVAAVDDEQLARAGLAASTQTEGAPAARGTEKESPAPISTVVDGSPLSVIVPTPRLHQQRLRLVVAVAQHALAGRWRAPTRC